MSVLRKFRELREMGNKTVIRDGNTDTKRFFALDASVYKDGAIDSKTKEMLGLIASMVLLCDDCIKYHLIRCKEEGVTKEEFYELFNIALVAGGSVIIPHIRRAAMFLDELKNDE